MMLADDARTAAPYFEQTVKLYADLRSRGVAHQQLPMQLALAEMNLGNIARSRGLGAAACEHFRRSAASLDEAPAEALRTAAWNPEYARSAARSCGPASTATR